MGDMKERRWEGGRGYDIQIKNMNTYFETHSRNKWGESKRAKQSRAEQSKPLDKSSVKQQRG